MSEDFFPKVKNELPYFVTCYLLRQIYSCSFVLSIWYSVIMFSVNLLLLACVSVKLNNCDYGKDNTTSLLYLLYEFGLCKLHTRLTFDWLTTFRAVISSSVITVINLSLLQSSVRLTQNKQQVALWSSLLMSYYWNSEKVSLAMWPVFGVVFKHKHVLYISQGLLNRI